MIWIDSFGSGVRHKYSTKEYLRVDGEAKFGMVTHLAVVGKSIHDLS
jgi:hypothetical protein